MTYLSDPRYIETQYKDSANLDARIALHSRFSLNSQGWLPWMFAQLNLPPGCRLLELGCGPGSLWRENLHRIPPDWQICLSDFSSGMVATARKNLRQMQPQPQFFQINAERLPFADCSFDGIIANHMLYHVPNRRSALAEIRRVLRGGGQLYAATGGRNHMIELDQLAARYRDELPGSLSLGGISFSLENGQAQLEEFFENVQLYRYPDALDVTEAAALADYITSTRRFGLTSEGREKLVAWLNEELQKSGGVIHIQKDAGVFIAERAV